MQPLQWNAMAQKYTANTNLNGKNHQQKHHFNIKISMGACTQNMGKALEEPINNASRDNNTRRNFYSVTLCRFLKTNKTPIYTCITSIIVSVCGSFHSGKQKKKKQQ